VTGPYDSAPQPIGSATPGVTPAGWYQVADGRVIWWDGNAWGATGQWRDGGWHAAAALPAPFATVVPPAAGYPPYAAYPQQWTGAPAAGPPGSKVAAGLLQLLLGLVLGLGGVGRIYARANRNLGIVMLVLSGVAWVLTLCSGFFLSPLLGTLVIWFVIDGIVLLCGHPRDDYGRPLA
jgi:hypothetical protein